MLIDRFYSRAQIERLLFRTEDALGRMIYFPNGAFGPGFIVATEEQKQRIIRAYIWAVDIFIVTFFTAAFVSSFLNVPPFATALVTVALGLIWFHVSARLSVRGQEKSQTSLTLREVRRQMAKSADWRWLVILGAGSTILFVAHVLALGQGRSWELLIRTALFGLCTVSIGHAIYLKWTLRG